MSDSHASRTARAYEVLDKRVPISKCRELLNHIFPDHWSFMIGELALYSFILLVLTGVFLTLYFIPSDTMVTYHGSYLPLRGMRVSEAYASTLRLSFDVRAGLLMRQVHHWAANIFVGAIVVHMARVFFTGAFRRPRELNWMIGLTMFALAIFNGYLGYSLPDDMLSGTGVRIAFSILESIPVVGTYLGFFLFGGNFPGTDVTERFFILHVLILPGAIVVLLGAHLLSIWKQEHTQFPMKGAAEDKVVGSPLWPNYAARSIGFMMLVFGAIFALAGLVQINPIWQYGPFLPFKASDAAQPDWYMGWLEGALRLWPPWETVLGGHMIAAPFYPTVLLPVGTWILLYAYPALEAKLTGDHAQHHLLDRPRDRPIRTAFGVSAFSFYFVLFVAGGDDVWSNYFDLSVNDAVWALRIACFVVPVLSAAVAYRICKELQRVPRDPRRPRLAVVERGEAMEYRVTPVMPPQPDGLMPLEVTAIADELVHERMQSADGDGKSVTSATREGPGS